MSRYLLILILVLGLWLRVFNLDQNPIGFFCDEADIGYTASQFLHTGNIAGNKIAFYSPSFGFFRPTIAIYSATPFIAAFGLNEFAVRLAPAFFGTLTIFLVYLLVKKLLSRELLALLSAFLLAISPWHIHFSRTGFECIYLPFFLALSIYIFLSSVSQKNLLLYGLSFLSFGLTLYTYLPAPLMVFPLLAFLSIIYLRQAPPCKINFSLLTNRSQTSRQMKSENKKSRIHWKSHFFGWMIFLLLATPIVSRTLSRERTVDYFWTNSVFSQTNLSLKEKATHIVSNYLLQFSPDFLFDKGDIGFPGQFITRHSVRGMGELYSWQFIFILVGLFYLLVTCRKKSSQVILSWLILYPVGSLFTSSSPYANRLIAGTVPWQIICAIGISHVFTIFNLISKKIIKKLFFYQFGIFLITLILVYYSINNFYTYLKLYHQEYPKYSADFWGWQYGAHAIMKYFLSVEKDYDELFMSGEYNGGEIFLKFYDPKNLCQNKCKMTDFFSQPTLVNPNKKQIFALSPNYLDKSKFKDQFIVKKTIYYPNNHIAFFIGEIN